MSTVEVAVVGRGMIGSAAARHLAERGFSIALIGPAEPADRTSGDGPFSSHGDEGRVTRVAGRTTVWSSLAARSIGRYAEIEQRSGISFHGPSGFLVSVPEIDTWLDTGLVAGSNVHRIDVDEVHRFSGIRLTNGHPVAYEGPPAGYINPRRLVAAQIRLTEAAGGTVISSVVDAIEHLGGEYEISGSWGTLRARRVLVATGGFGRSLLERELMLERRPRTVLLAELAGQHNIPSLILTDPPDERLEESYWVPPLPYPDGRTYLKIGGTLRTSSVLAGDDELVEWFHSDGDATEIEALENSLGSLLPAATITSTSSLPCVVTGTGSGYPYIGWVDDGLCVAIGGNGAAAKSSDELGRLAASMFADEGWDDTLDQALFEPQFR